MAVAVPAFAQVYKWVDERGVTHYGERPPQGRKSTEVPHKLGTPAAPASAADTAAKTTQRLGVLKRTLISALRYLSGWSVAASSITLMSP